MEENEVSNKIIGAAIEVHKILGCGLLESIYEEALCIELTSQNISFERQVAIDVALAQVLSYLKATGVKRALLINFGEKRLVDGIRRISN